MYENLLKSWISSSIIHAFEANDKHFGVTIVSARVSCTIICHNVLVLTYTNFFLEIPLKGFFNVSKNLGSDKISISKIFKE